MPSHWTPVDLAAAWRPERWRDERLLLAVSGGGDSMALLRALASLADGAGMDPARLVVAHVNHALRGADSDADEALVRETAAALGLPCEVRRLEPAAAPASEEQARDARYALLTEIALAAGARYVVTAHTADDQAETILHHILRGAGLAGVAGMSRTRQLHPAVTLIRPLLTFRRAQLEGYLSAIGQPYRTDGSNRDLRFTRNRVRHALLPQLAADFNPEIIPALLRLGRLAGDAQEALADLVDPLVETCVRQVPSGLEIDCAPLARAHRHVVREVLLAAWRQAGWPQQGMGLSEWESLATLVFDGGKLTLPGNVQAERSGNVLRLTRQPCS